MVFSAPAHTANTRVPIHIVHFMSVSPLIDLTRDIFPHRAFLVQAEPNLDRHTTP
ncbi:MAG: hypothetical protein AMXMBFR84_01690 [Candidatus Hydrogenedentota bacterium]